MTEVKEETEHWADLRTGSDFPLFVLKAQRSESNQMWLLSGILNHLWPSFPLTFDQ